MARRRGIGKKLFTLYYEGYDIVGGNYSSLEEASIGLQPGDTVIEWEKKATYRMPKTAPELVPIK